MEQRESVLAILWRRDGWRCEYWKSASTTGTVRLYLRQTLAMHRQVRDVDEMLFVATTWKSLIVDAERAGIDRPTLPVEERRHQSGERRAVRRGGRRQDDPGA